MLTANATPAVTAVALVRAYLLPPAAADLAAVLVTYPRKGIVPPCRALLPIDGRMDWAERRNMGRTEQRVDIVVCCLRR